VFPAREDNVEEENTEINGSAENEIAQAMSHVIEKAHDLRKTILEATVCDEHIWFQNMLVGILNCALLDHNSVVVGAQKSIYLAAWGRRNLLELRVITTYVLTSEKNANDFKSDLLIDGKEFYEALTMYQKASHTKLLAMASEMAMNETGPMKVALMEFFLREAKDGPKTEETDSEAEIYSELMAESGLKTNAKPKMAGEIARLINESDDFIPMNKICSKIMHRTVLSIASSTVHKGLDATIPFLSTSADNDFLAVYYAIDEYVQKRGVQPPVNV
jgi:hypothetical protein